MVPSSSRSRRYGLPSGKAARATRAVSSGTGRTRRSGSDTERPQEERRRYGVSYYTICPCSLEVNSPAVSLSMKAALLRTGKTKNPLENEGHCIGWRPRPLRIRTLRKLARLRHETASLAIAALRGRRKTSCPFLTTRGLLAALTNPANDQLVFRRPLTRRGVLEAT